LFVQGRRRNRRRRIGAEERCREPIPSERVEQGSPPSCEVQGDPGHGDTIATQVPSFLFCCLSSACDLSFFSFASHLFLFCFARLEPPTHTHTHTHTHKPTHSESEADHDMSDPDYEDDSDEPWSPPPSPLCLFISSSGCDLFLFRFALVLVLLCQVGTTPRIRTHFLISLPPPPPVFVYFFKWL
jgi:hypothetical protein